MRRLLLLSAALLLATAAAFEGAAEAYEFDRHRRNVEPDDGGEQRQQQRMPPYPETIGDFVKLASDVGKGPAGECAVGLSCGAAAGWIVRRVQGALVATAIVSAIGTGAMLHLGWVTPETVRRRRRRSARAPPPPLCPRAAAARRRAALTTAAAAAAQALAVVGTLGHSIKEHVRKKADLDGDGELTLEDSKLASSKVTPFVKRRPILSGGFATGCARLRDALTNTADGHLRVGVNLFMGDKGGAGGNGWLPARTGCRSSLSRANRVHSDAASQSRLVAGCGAAYRMS